MHWHLDKSRCNRLHDDGGRFSSAIGTAGSWIVSIALLLFTFTTACAQIEFSCVALVKLIGQKERRMAAGFSYL